MTPEIRAAMTAAMTAAAKRAWSDPETRAKRSAAQKRAWSDPETRKRARARRAGCGCDVPQWVPEELIEDFIDVACLAGEEVAASHVRKLKLEMERS